MKGKYSGSNHIWLQRIADYRAVEFGVSPLAAAMLGVLLCGVILGITTSLFALLAWKDGYWSPLGRIHYTVLAVATLAFVWWLNYWNLLAFRY